MKIHLAVLLEVATYIETNRQTNKKKTDITSLAEVIMGINYH